MVSTCPWAGKECLSRVQQISRYACAKKAIAMAFRRMYETGIGYLRHSLPLFFCTCLEPSKGCRVGVKRRGKPVITLHVAQTWGWRLAEWERDNKKRNICIPKKTLLIRCHPYLASVCHSRYLQLPFLEWTFEIGCSCGILAVRLCRPLSRFEGSHFVLVGTVEGVCSGIPAEGRSPNLIGSEKDLSSFFVLCNEGVLNLVGCGGCFCLRQAWVISCSMRQLSTARQPPPSSCYP